MRGIRTRLSTGSIGRTDRVAVSPITAPPDNNCICNVRSWSLNTSIFRSASGNLASPQRNSAQRLLQPIRCPAKCHKAGPHRFAQPSRSGCRRRPRCKNLMPMQRPTPPPILATAKRTANVALADQKAASLDSTKLRQVSKCSRQMSVPCTTAACGSAATPAGKPVR